MAIALFAAAVAGGAEVTGRRARTSFTPPAELGARRWAAVADAGEAVRVWADAGLHGRRLLLLTGRWALVQSMNVAVAEAASTGASLDVLDANTAVLAAVRATIARDLLVVMPPAAYARRVAEVGAPKELRRGDGWFDLPFHGFARRFAMPGAVEAPAEPVLALVEPSFFAEGAPPAPDAWLRERGFDVELGLVALADPAATPEQRDRAALFAEGAHAAVLEVAR